MISEERVKKLDEIGWFDEMLISERKRFIRRGETVCICPSESDESIEKKVQELADASWGMFAPTDIKWERGLPGFNDRRLSFKQNGRFYSVIVPDGNNHLSEKTYRRFPPQILIPINQALADAGYRSRYFVRPYFIDGDLCLYLLVPKDAYQRAIQQGLEEELTSPLSELLEELIRIQVDLPEIDEADSTDGDDYCQSVWAKPRSESVWAKPLGGDLYAIRSVPLYAYNLHFDDLVKAAADAPGAEPKISEVVKPSLHKTIRIKFADGVPETEKSRVLDELEESGEAIIRNRDEHIYGIDFHPREKYEWISDEIQREELLKNYIEIQYEYFLYKFIYGGIFEFESGDEGDERIDDESIYEGFLDSQKNLDFYFQLLEASRSNNNLQSEAETLYDIGMVYKYIPDKSWKGIEFLKLAANLSYDLGITWREQFSLENIGDIYHAIKNYQQAIRFYESALPLLADDKKKRKAELLLEIEDSYKAAQGRHNVFEFYYQYVRSTPASYKRADEHLIFIRLGFIYHSLGENHKALDCFKQSLRLAEGVPFDTYGLLGDKHHKIDFLNQLLKIKNKQNELDFLNQLLKMTRKSDDRETAAALLCQMAYVAVQSGNYKEAAEQMESALEIIDLPPAQSTNLNAQIEYSATLRNHYETSLKGYYKFYDSIRTELHERHPAEGYDVKARQANERMDKLLVNEQR